VRSRHFPLWTLLGVVLIVALLVGSGVFSSSPQTNAQRAAALESVIRCPSCEDLSVAVSSASTAVTVRATILPMVDQGRTDQQIEGYLTARYGSSIVLDPPASGWSALVWVLPIVGGLAGTSVLVWVFVRRRFSGTDVDADVRGPTVDPVALDERRRFLAQSLADADAEYLAGDLEDADYLALRQRDLTRLATLGPAAATSATMVAAPAVDRTAVATATLVDDPAVATGAAVVPVGSTTIRRRSRNTWFLVGAIGCFVAALALAVPLFSSDRLPGQSATGSVALSPSQQVSSALDQAAAVENQGQLGLAAQLYQTVLTGHPDNEVALAQLGWLEYRIGQQGASATLVSDARSKLSRAATLDPGDYAVHLYLGTLLLQSDRNAPGAVDQFAEFLADKPPATVLAQAASVLHQAYTAAGKPIPTGIPTI
jgi:cytochrome c-type biogenesis protein CcmH